MAKNFLDTSSNGLLGLFEELLPAIFLVCSLVSGLFTEDIEKVNEVHLID